jgi:3D (Asp-Asp-Asp) domain-containing protein
MAAITLTNVIFSAYCACKICCGPGASGITAAGTKPEQFVTVAGPRKYPLGTRISIDGISELPKDRRSYKVDDRTARKWDGKRWDIYFKNHEAARRFGLKTGTVTIISVPKSKEKK